VMRVTTLVGEIMKANSAHSAGIDQINQAMSQMERMQHEDNVLATELSEIARTLRFQARRALEAISAFNLRADLIDATAVEDGLRHEAQLQPVAMRSAA